MPACPTNLSTSAQANKLIESLRLAAPSLSLWDISEADEGACPYGTQRSARFIYGAAEHIDGAEYRWILEHGGRRTGNIFYFPCCCECAECMPLRVPVREFLPSRSQARYFRRDKPHISVRVERPAFSISKLNLYAKYLRQWHGKTDAPWGIMNLLGPSPIDTLEIQYRFESRLVAISIADMVPGALSSVYVFFDPDYARLRLGTFSALWEIQWAREMGLDYYYLGYWIPHCRAMSYKSRFRPCEVMDWSDYQWRLISDH
ncbi:MAG: arginyltransferase [Candidatus Sumerlaeota bacterium]|nr:arginyltransferase [Candidatus Sumerlaeota bacterium]